MKSAEHLKQFKQAEKLLGKLFPMKKVNKFEAIIEQIEEAVRVLRKNVPSNTLEEANRWTENPGSLQQIDHIRNLFAFWRTVNQLEIVVSMINSLYALVGGIRNGLQQEIDQIEAFNKLQKKGKE